MKPEYIWNGIIRREQNELKSRIQKEFWNEMYFEIFWKRRMHEEFFLVSDKLSYEDVVDHMKNFLKSLCFEFDLKFFETDYHYKKEYKLRLLWLNVNKHFCDETSIMIYHDQIILKFIPQEKQSKVFYKEQYMLVEKIISQVCKDLFKDNQKKLNQLIQEYDRIDATGQGLTKKTIEIAQGSIKALYIAANHNNSSLVQRYLYSSMLIDGKTVRIFHKDFLENPDKFKQIILGK